MNICLNLKDFVNDGVSEYLETLPIEIREQYEFQPIHSITVKDHNNRIVFASYNMLNVIKKPRVRKNRNKRKKLKIQNEENN